MKRRNFIILAATGVAGVAIPTWYFTSGELKYNPLLNEPELLSYIWDEETILEIGNLYLEKFPKENSERKLVKAISESNFPDKDTLEFLQKEIQDDFIADDIVMLDGWLLSHTEARQCALFSLKQIKQ